MTPLQRRLLVIDAWINFILGAVLLAIPAGFIQWLGLPPTETYFYASILGAVLLGIGLALYIEVQGVVHGLSGLGLAGAIVINLVASTILIIWLILKPFQLPFRGYMLLWGVAIVILGIAIAELVTGLLQKEKTDE